MIQSDIIQKFLRIWILFQANTIGAKPIIIYFIANFPGFYNSMYKKPTITAFFEVYDNIFWVVTLNSTKSSKRLTYQVIEHFE